MPPEASRRWIQRYFDEVTNQGKLQVANELFAVDYLHHDPANPDPHGVKGVEDVKRHLKELLDAFPDTKFTVEAIVADGDDVVARWTVRCTHTGNYFGIPPTGKSATITGMNTWRITGGMAVEGWVNRDDIGLLQQLGVIPTPGQ
jgi:steroid delta-isomerase-like uncharacterized protein